MLIPKDKGLRVSRSGETLVMEFNHDRGYVIIPATFVGFFPVFMCVAMAFTPSTTYPERPMPDVPWLYAGVAFAVLSIWCCWLLWFWRTSIEARPDGLTVRPSFFSQWFTQDVSYVPAQFYLKGGSRTSGTSATTCLYCLDPDEQEVRLTRSIPKLTMARQIWTLLQDYYDLPDLEVLGELEHEKLAEGRAKRRAEDRG